MNTLKLFITMFFILILEVSLSACVDKVEFTIYFESNGGSEVLPVVTSGTSTVTIPNNPIKEGYTFVGWFWDDVTFETLFTSNSLIDAPLSSDMTVYAKWDRIEYNISYELNGGINNSSNPQTFYFGATEIVLIDPTKEGYTFGGWYSDAEFTTTYTFTTIPAEDITLYVKWNINSYTLQFVDSDGTVLQTNDFEYQADLSSITPPLATKEGYTFTEWDIQIPASMPAEDVTLGAIYKINNYTISFESNGGTEYEPEIHSYNININPPTAPIKEGYVFLGWFVDSEFENEFVFNSMPSMNITLYAKWVTNFQYLYFYFSENGMYYSDEISSGYEIETEIDEYTYTIDVEADSSIYLSLLFNGGSVYYSLMVSYEYTQFSPFFLSIAIYDDTVSMLGYDENATYNFDTGEATIDFDYYEWSSEGLQEITDITEMFFYQLMIYSMTYFYLVVGVPLI